MLIFLSVLKVGFAEYRILGWQFFLCRTLTMSSHCHLASMVSDEKSAVNLTENLLYVMSHFSLAAFKILCLSIAWLWYALCAHFKFILLEVLEALWVDRLMFFIKFGKFLFLQIFFLMLFLLSFWDSLFSMLLCLIVSHRSLRLCPFLFIFCLSVSQHGQYQLTYL